MLNEAFKKLNLLEDVFSFSDEGIKKLGDIEEIEKDDEIQIIDPEAETVEDIKDSYEGNIILDCNCCHSKLFKGKDEVVVSEDETIANADEECPYCYSHDGFTIIGEVAPFHKKEEKTEIDVKADDETSDVDVKVEDEEVNEAIYGLKNAHDTKGFGGKANVEIKDDGTKVLYSYDTPVVEISKDRGVKLLPDWKYSQTTLRHVREFLRQEGFKADSARQIEKDYGIVKEESVNESVANSINEGIDAIEIKADGQKIEVKTEKCEECDEKKEEEVIAPVTDEVKDEIIKKSEEENAEDEIDVDFDEFEEKKFDELGESYLKNVYENVNSYKTSKIKMEGNKIVVEGVINFKSGKNKKTSFVFESHKATKSGSVLFLGENAQITKGKKAFRLSGKIDEKKFVCESLTYRYSAKGNDGKVQRIYGTIKK